MARSIEGVSALILRIELTPLQCLSTAPASKGGSVSHYESLLKAEQILGTECVLMFSISPLILSMSLHKFYFVCVINAIMKIRYQKGVNHQQNKFRSSRVSPINPKYK